MVTELYERIQEGLQEKQKEITEFLETAPEVEKDVCLCEDDECIENHLHVIETSLEKIEENTLGVCVICHGYVDQQLLEMDYTAAVCLDHYSDEERRRLESELELSQVVQRALLPQRVPTIKGVELPASVARRRSSVVIILTSSSSGMGRMGLSSRMSVGMAFAGMLMSSLQMAIRTMAPETDSPGEILERINRFYIHNINFTTFVTVFLARFDPASLTMTYVNAGHNPPAIRRRRDSVVDWLNPTAPAIGLAEDFHPKMAVVEFSEGDFRSIPMELRKCWTFAMNSLGSNAWRNWCSRMLTDRPPICCRQSGRR